MKRPCLVLLLCLAGCTGRPAKEIEPPEPGEEKQPPRREKVAVEEKVAREEPKKRSAYEERIAAFRTAVEKGRVSEVKELLKTADVNDKDDDGQTPLMWAAAKGQTAVFLLLWNSGAMARERDAQGRSALMLAAEGNHVEVVRFLIAPDVAANTAGAALKLAGLEAGKLPFTGVASTANDTDKKGRTALMLALAAGAREAAVELMSPYRATHDLNLRDSQGKTTLMYAAAAGMRPQIEQMLERFTEVKPGLDQVTQKDKDGKTAAELARAAGHKEVAAMLEEFAKDPNAADEQGRTPLMKAILAGDQEAARRLLQRGVDRHVRDSEGKTAAIHAAVKGDWETLASLRYQQNNNYTNLLSWFGVADKQGKTALIYAAAGDHVRCITALIDEGNDVDGRGGPFVDYVVGLTTATDKEGRNALMHAAAAGNLAAARAILQAYGASNTSTANLPGGEPRRALLKRTDKAGKTAQQIAEEAKHATVVDLLKKFAG
jgi:ankyrin repeat protein